MGFFSKIKKLWKTDQEAAPQESANEAQDVAAQASPAAPQAELQWQNDLLSDLQQAEPRLSVWLEHIVKDVHRADQTLWDRLHFLFQCLEVPDPEARDFIRSFRHWLEEMDYERVEEFRSELQYRLALALDLEDEEDERSRLFIKLSQGLSKTKEQLSKQVDSLLNRSSEFDSRFWEELEEILVMADVGMQTTSKLIERMQSRVRESRPQSSDEFKALFSEELAALFPPQPKRIKPEPPEVWLMVGVNGVGKTTTIAKLAHRAQMQGRKVLIAAGDTFRAAAIEQLEIWSQRVGTGFYAKTAHSDPAAVAWEALDLACAEEYDLLIVDTAGRLHTKRDLMDELIKIRRVLNKKHQGAPHRTMLVLDATTGQNALSQTKLFQEGVNVDEIILTKLDGTAKGGVILSIASEYRLPITFVGLGEKMEDLRPFSPQDFARALLA
ncbi:signal recognition particle-docking protein FtsY [Desulfovermiculus halophilus]|uniref:signal recognition particle-docking protein FtsY n=1 Tax=Desulfovermiculus halophilus TaxID=339722 RepID=UPI000489C9E6|nr:signal recognition particle-docking protein FtsY [Desulfovermiculus halophilus]